MHKHNCERAQATALAHPARVLLRFKVSRRLDTARNQVGFWVRGRVYVGIVKRIQYLRIGVVGKGVSPIDRNLFMNRFGMYYAHLCACAASC